MSGARGEKEQMSSRVKQHQNVLENFGEMGEEKIMKVRIEVEGDSKTTCGPTQGIQVCIFVVLFGHERHKYQVLLAQY